MIKQRQLADHVQRRGAREHPLSAEGHARNVEIGVTRCAVERIFAQIKHHWGQRRTPFMGRVKTTTWSVLRLIRFTRADATRNIHRPFSSWISVNLNQIDGNPLWFTLSAICWNLWQAARFRRLYG